jgi:hypothetical protein
MITNGVIANNTNNTNNNSISNGFYLNNHNKSQKPVVDFPIFFI